MKEKLLALWRNPSLSGLVQFIKFGLVGVSNTLISFAVKYGCYYWLFASLAERPRIIWADVLAFVISVTNSYYWNNRFVFRGGEKLGWRTHLKTYLKTYLKTVACYGVTGLLLGPALELALTGWGVPYYLGSLLTLVVTIPLNFALNKFWAYRK